MSYTDFINYWQEGNKKWEVYRKDVLRVVDAIYDCFVNELQVDANEDCLKIFPIKEKDTKIIVTKLYHHIHCIELEDNGWANVGILLSLKSNQNEYSKQYFRFKLSIRLTSMAEQKWKVKIAEDGKEHLISNELGKNELKEIWKEFEKLVKFSTLDALEHWLELK